MTYADYAYDAASPRRPRRKGNGAKIFAAVLALSTVGVFGAGAAVFMNKRQPLSADSLDGIKAEALAMFPRGSHVGETATKLKDMGFDCIRMEHPLPDISATSMVCSSNGRGWPTTPGYYMTVTARNEMLTDLSIWNVIARSDEETDEITDHIKESLGKVSPPKPPPGFARIGS